MVKNGTKEKIKDIERQSIANYYKEDKIVMLDESILRIKSIMFFIYDMIYFGNKIEIPKEMLKKVKANKDGIYRIQSENCKYLLDTLEKNKDEPHENYKIVDLGSKGKKFEERVYKYLIKHPDVVYLVERKKTFEYLKQKGLGSRVKWLHKGTVFIRFCKRYKSYFATLGFIKHEDGEMYIHKRNGDTLIKVYNKDFKEKVGETVFVDVGDTILVRSTKDIKYCFNIYEVYSKHTRNNAINVIWTDLLKGEKTNFYIKKLDKNYQKIIEENSNFEEKTK